MRRGFAWILGITFAGPAWAAEPVDAVPVGLVVSRRVEPTYPSAAVGLPFGTVRCDVEVVVGGDGRAAEVAVLGCPTVFREATRAAVGQWSWTSDDGSPPPSGSGFPLVLRFRVFGAGVVPEVPGLSDPTTRWGAWLDACSLGEAPSCRRLGAALRRDGRVDAARLVLTHGRPPRRGRRGRSRGSRARG